MLNVVQDSTFRTMSVFTVRMKCIWDLREFASVSQIFKQLYLL